MNNAHCRYITFNVVLWKCEKVEPPLVKGIASMYSQVFVTEFHLKVLHAYAGTKNKTKIKMATVGLERCYTDGRTWEEIEEEEQLWEDMDGAA
jgi:hypothetical protein